METLDRVVMDPTKPIPVRMECISLFRYILERKNLKNNTKLDYWVNVDT